MACGFLSNEGASGEEAVHMYPIGNGKVSQMETEIKSETRDRELRF